MSKRWDTDEFPCPHCLVIALVEGMLEFGVDPQEIASLVVEGLKEGLEGTEGVTIMTNEEFATITGDTVH